MPDFPGLCENAQETPEIRRRRTIIFIIALCEFNERFVNSYVYSSVNRKVRIEVENIYTNIGPEKLRVLVDRFYDIIFNESEITHLFTTDPGLIRDKQYRFLTQFLGGPQLYNEQYGHPRMRQRHGKHIIDNAAKVEWLRCMRKAIDSMGFEIEFADSLYNCFPKLADHMQNH
ncbi:MAG: hemoglobin [Crocinitomicaceae bacterium]|jgi:hemoglobin